MSGARPIPSTPTHEVIVPAFALHIDFLLLSLFALYVISTLPRALVRLSQPSEIFNGSFLRSGARTAPGRSDSTRALLRADTLRIGRSGTANTISESRVNANAPPVQRSTGARAASGEKNEVTDSFPALVIPVSNRARRIRQPCVPTRVPRWTSFVHPSLAFALNFRVSPGFSLGRLLVLLAYGLIVFYACLYRSNPLTDPIRASYIAVSQIPIVVALATKSNWLSWLSGVGYEKLNYVHRFSGRAVIIAVNVHALGHLYKLSIAHLQVYLRTPLSIWGLVALCALDLLFVCSILFRGDKMYSLFVATHVIFVVISLVAIYMHQPPMLPYILAAVGLYAFDHIVRIARTHYTTAWLTAENALNGGTTLVNVPFLGSGWRAGQHVRIRVIGDTWPSWLATWLVSRARPFTIATGSNSGGMLLVIKARGAWTGKLLRMAAAAGPAAVESTDPEHGPEPGRKVRIIVEGPYSGPGHVLYTAYSGVVLVAGGSGISYVTGVLDEILQKHASGQSNVRVIEVVWSVADPDSLYSLLPMLAPLMRPRASPRAALSLRFSVHWTRKSALAPQVPRTELPLGMHLRAGRPDVRATLQSAIASVADAYSTTSCCKCTSDSPSGIVIGTCGPTALLDDAALAVGGVSWEDWMDVGGVESIDQVFGW